MAPSRPLLALLALLVLLSPAVGQPGPEERPGPGVALVVHHPYPDAADPLGFPWPDDGSRGPFLARHGHLDTERDGFDFPTVVVDGVLLVEGLPEGDPQKSTDEAYTSAIERRALEEAPVVLKTFTTEVEGERRLMVQVEPRAALDGEDLRLWAALVEQPVVYRPPPALSNGIEDHPYTLRALADLGPLDLADGRPEGAAHAFAMNGSWDPERLFAAVWVQQGGGHGLRFDAHEVVQATSHPWMADHVTVQGSKGVLLESFSATWCDPCLYGDRAVEKIARSHGLPAGAAGGGGALYFLPPSAWVVAVAAAVGVLVAVVRWPCGRAGGADTSGPDPEGPGHVPARDPPTSDAVEPPAAETSHAAREAP